MLTAAEANLELQNFMTGNGFTLEVFNKLKEEDFTLTMVNSTFLFPSQPLPFPTYV